MRNKGKSLFMLRFVMLAVIGTVLSACASPKVPLPVSEKTPEQQVRRMISDRMLWLAPEQKWHYNCLFLKPVAELNQRDLQFALPNADLLFKAHFEEKRLAYRSAGALYRQAGNQGVAYALAKLGNLLIDGKGVQPNPTGGAVLMRQSAQLDCALAQHRYGELLAKGIGVRANLMDAWTWLDLAREQGYPESKVLQEKIEPFLSLAQRAVAIEQAKLLRAQIDLFNKGVKGQTIVACTTDHKKQTFYTRMNACHAMGGTHIGEPLEFNQ